MVSSTHLHLVISVRRGNSSIAMYRRYIYYFTISKYVSSYEERCVLSFVEHNVYMTSLLIIVLGGFSTAGIVANDSNALQQAVMFSPCKDFTGKLPTVSSSPTILSILRKNAVLSAAPHNADPL